MKFGNFGSFIKYIRNHVLEQPTKKLDGDDLQIEIYDNEICFTVNDLYAGPKIMYIPSRKDIKIIFREVEQEFTDEDANVNIAQIKVATDIVRLIEGNIDMLDNFLSREEK